MAHTEPSTSRATGIAIWVLRVIVGGLFLFAAYMKLSGQQMMIDEFGTVGLGQWFRYFTGLLELAGGILVLIPAWSLIGALIVLVVDIGAFFAQVFVIRMDFIHTIVIGAVILVLIYLQRGSLRR